MNWLPLLLSVFSTVGLAIFVVSALGSQPWMVLLFGAIGCLFYALFDEAVMEGNL